MMSRLRKLTTTAMPRYTVLGPVLAGIFVITIASACDVEPQSVPAQGPDSAESAPTARIPLTTVPPCTPVPGSDRDPCERFPNQGEDSHVYAVGHIFGKPPLPLDPEWLFRSAWDTDGIKTPQIVVRGVGVADSSRCSEVAAYNFGGGDYSVAPADAPYTMEVCHIDFDVREYIVGTGPSRIPVIVEWHASVLRTSSDYGTESYFNKLESPIRDVFEGNEKILELVQPSNLAWGDWSNSHAWDVQMRSDGLIVGVSGKWPLFAHDSEVEDWEYPLDELQQKLKTAHDKVAAEHGGRISDGPDSPMLVTDASRESLLAQLRELGAYDAPGITPAPAPTVAPRGVHQ